MGVFISHTSTSPSINGMNAINRARHLHLNSVHTNTLAMDSTVFLDNLIPLNPQSFRTLLIGKLQRHNNYQGQSLAEAGKLLKHLLARKQETILSKKTLTILRQQYQTFDNLIASFQKSGVINKTPANTSKLEAVISPTGQVTVTEAQENKTPSPPPKKKKGNLFLRALKILVITSSLSLLPSNGMNINLPISIDMASTAQSLVTAPAFTESPASLTLVAEQASSPAPVEASPPEPKITVEPAPKTTVLEFHPQGETDCTDAHTIGPNDNLTTILNKNGYTIRGVNGTENIQAVIKANPKFFDKMKKLVGKSIGQCLKLPKGLKQFKK